MGSIAKENAQCKDTGESQPPFRHHPKGVVENGGESLPCLYRNNSIENNEKNTSQSSSESKKHRKAATALAYNVTSMSIKYGLKNLGFLTLTFADNVQCYKEASKRFNSLKSNVLNERYNAFIKVMERQKSGRIHYHLLVALKFDIRSGFNFAEAEKRVYKSASKELRAEWSFWRSTAKKYRFGRTELLPIKSSHEAIGRYVGKYIAKHMDQRLSQDKGARLVSYSKEVRAMNTKFSWVTSGAAQWRSKVAIFAHIVSETKGVEPTFEGLREALGPKWAHNHRDYIASIEI